MFPKKKKTGSFANFLLPGRHHGNTIASLLETFALKLKTIDLVDGAGMVRMGILTKFLMRLNIRGVERSLKRVKLGLKMI